MASLIRESVSLLPTEVARVEVFLGAWAAVVTFFGLS